MRGLILSLLSVSGLLAQTFHITGNYLDLLDNPIDSASVYYYQDHVVVDSTLTNSAGAFDMQFTIVSTNPSLPSAFSLSQNYPNPFNPSTRIDLSIQEPGSFSIYDIRGALVETLDLPTAGSYELTWGGRNLAAGLYIYVLRSGSQSSSRKMILLDGGDGSGLSASQLSYGQSQQLSKPASNDKITFAKQNTSGYELNFTTPLADTSLGILNGNVGPKQIQTIRDTTMYEGDTLSIDWDEYFYNDSETFYPHQFAEYMYFSDTMFYDNAKVAIDILDTNLVAVSNTYRVTWLPVNDSPVVLWSPMDTSMQEDDTLTIDLTTVFADEDSELSFEVAGLLNVDWSISADSMLIIVPQPDWFGTIPQVILTASDSSFMVSTDPFDITVTAVNDAPVFETILPDTSVYLEETLALALNCVDVDDSLLAYSLNQPDSIWYIEQDSLFITPSDTGYYDLSIVASDPSGLTDTLLIALDVQPWETWKHITGTIRDIYTLEGLEGLTVQLLDSATIIRDWYNPFGLKDITEQPPELINVIGMVQSDVNGFFTFSNILTGDYVLNVLPADTNHLFLKKGMIISVSNRSNYADSLSLENDYIMIPKTLIVPNGAGATVNVDLLGFYEGKMGLVDFEILDRNYQTHAWLNVHDMYDRVIQLYLGGFSAEDSLQLLSTIALGDSLFGKTGRYEFGRDEPWGFPSGSNLHQRYDPELNYFPDTLGWNIYEYYSRPPNIGHWNNATYPQSFYKPDVMYIGGGSVVLSSIGGVVSLKELYARVSGWGDVPAQSRNSLMNLTASEATEMDRALDYAHSLYAKRLATGYEKGYFSDYREE